MKPTIAVLGASTDRSKFGNKAVRAYLQQGYDVFPVNPKADSVEGTAAYPTVADIPVSKLDRVTVYLPAPVALGVLGQLAEKEIGEVHFNPGADDPEVLAKARELGLNVVTGCSILAIGVRPDELG